MLTNTPQHTAGLFDPLRSECGFLGDLLDIDWRAVRRAERSCCCASRPAVIAVMPRSPGRPRSTELLLCGHHYRGSRRELEAAGATVLDPSGTPVSPQQLWVGQQA